MGKTHMMLHLLHGRKTLEEELENWGTEGPHIPIESIHFTYDTLYIMQNDQRIELDKVGDCILWDDVLYGDFVVYNETEA